MAIQKKPKRSTNDVDSKSAEAFVSGAVTPVAPPKLEVKKPVALRMDRELLTRIDKAAKHRGVSRNALISYYCSRGLDEDE